MRFFKSTWDVQSLARQGTTWSQEKIHRFDLPKKLTTSELEYYKIKTHEK